VQNTGRNTAYEMEIAGILLLELEAWALEVRKADVVEE
jgi:hypothetical protein